MLVSRSNASNRTSPDSVSRNRVEVTAKESSASVPTLSAVEQAYLDGLRARLSGDDPADEATLNSSSVAEAMKQDPAVPSLGAEEQAYLASLRASLGVVRSEHSVDDTSTSTPITPSQHTPVTWFSGQETPKSEEKPSNTVSSPLLLLPRLGIPEDLGLGPEERALLASLQGQARSDDHEPVVAGEDEAVMVGGSTLGPAERAFLAELQGRPAHAEVETEEEASPAIPDQVSMGDPDEAVIDDSGLGPAEKALLAELQRRPSSDVGVEEISAIVESAPLPWPSLDTTGLSAVELEYLTNLKAKPNGIPPFETTPMADEAPMVIESVLTTMASAAVTTSSLDNSGLSAVEREYLANLRAKIEGVPPPEPAPVVIEAQVSEEPSVGSLEESTDLFGLGAAERELLKQLRGEEAPAEVSTPILNPVSTASVVLEPVTTSVPTTMDVDGLGEAERAYLANLRVKVGGEQTGQDETRLSPVHEPMVTTYSFLDSTLLAELGPDEKALLARLQGSFEDSTPTEAEPTGTVIGPPSVSIDSDDSEGAEDEASEPEPSWMAGLGQEERAYLKDLQSKVAKTIEPSTGLLNDSNYQSSTTPMAAPLAPASPEKSRLGELRVKLDREQLRQRERLRELSSASPPDTPLSRPRANIEESTRVQALLKQIADLEKRLDTSNRVADELRSEAASQKERRWNEEKQKAAGAEAMVEGLKTALYGKDAELRARDLTCAAQAKRIEGLNEDMARIERDLSAKYSETLEEMSRHTAMLEKLLAESKQESSGLRQSLSIVQAEHRSADAAARDLTAKLDSFVTQIRQKDDAIAARELKCSEQVREVQELHQNLIDLENQLKAKHDETLNELTQQVTELESRLAEVKGEAENRSRLLSRTEEAKQLNDAKLSKLQEELASLRAELKTKEGALEAAIDAAKPAEELVMQAVELEKQLLEYKERNEELEAKVARAEEEQALNDARREALEAQLEAFKAHEEEATRQGITVEAGITEEIADLEARLAASKEENAALKAAALEATKEKKAREAKIADLDQRIDLLQADMKATADKLSESTAESRALAKQVADLESKLEESKKESGFLRDRLSTGGNEKMAEESKTAELVLQLELLKTQLAEKDDQLARRDAETFKEAKKAQELALMIADLESSIVHLKEQNASLETEAARATEERLVRDQVATHLEKQLDALTAKFREKEVQIQARDKNTNERLLKAMQVMSKYVASLEERLAKSSVETEELQAYVSRAMEEGEGRPMVYTGKGVLFVIFSLSVALVIVLVKRAGLESTVPSRGSEPDTAVVEEFSSLSVELVPVLEEGVEEKDEIAEIELEVEKAEVVEIELEVEEELVPLAQVVDETVFASLKPNAMANFLRGAKGSAMVVDLDDSSALGRLVKALRADTAVDSVRAIQHDSIVSLYFALLVVMIRSTCRSVASILEESELYRDVHFSPLHTTGMQPDAFANFVAEAGPAMAFKLDESSALGRLGIALRNANDDPVSTIARALKKDSLFRIYAAAVEVAAGSTCHNLGAPITATAAAIHQASAFRLLERVWGLQEPDKDETIENEPVTGSVGRIVEALRSVKYDPLNTVREAVEKDSLVGLYMALFTIVTGATAHGVADVLRNASDFLDVKMVERTSDQPVRPNALATFAIGARTETAMHIDLDESSGIGRAIQLLQDAGKDPVETLKRAVEEGSGPKIYGTLLAVMLASTQKAVVGLPLFNAPVAAITDDALLDVNSSELN